jgi:hypothetical protein
MAGAVLAEIGGDDEEQPPPQSPQAGKENSGHRKGRKKYNLLDGSFKQV